MVSPLFLGKVTVVAGMQCAEISVVDKQHRIGAFEVSGFTVRLSTEPQRTYEARRRGPRTPVPGDERFTDAKQRERDLYTLQQAARGADRGKPAAPRVETCRGSIGFGSGTGVYEWTVS